VTFDAGAFSRRTRYVEWDFGDGFTDSVEVPVHTYRVPGLYDVRVRMWTATGCRDTVERVYPGAIRVNPRPKVAMAIAPQRVTIYQPLIQVRADSVDADEQFWFDMDDSTTYAQQAFVVHTYRDTGWYAVKMLALNQFGCWDTLVDSVRVDPIYNVWSPTAFTPNGDGGNEGFRPVATGIRAYRLRILDRWGNVVFQSSDPQAEWNGRVGNDGAECPQGAYTWSLFTIDYGDSPVEQQGVVLLIR
jgi:gliding motility-associated-like protein